MTYYEIIKCDWIALSSTGIDRQFNSTGPVGWTTKVRRAVHLSNFSCSQYDVYYTLKCNIIKLRHQAMFFEFRWTVYKKLGTTSIKTSSLRAFHKVLYHKFTRFARSRIAATAIESNKWRLTFLQGIRYNLYIVPWIIWFRKQHVISNMIQ